MIKDKVLELLNQHKQEELDDAAMQVTTRYEDLIAAVQELPEDVPAGDGSNPSPDVVAMQARIAELEKMVQEMQAQKDAMSQELEALKLAKAQEDEMLAKDEKKIGDAKAVLES